MTISTTTAASLKISTFIENSYKISRSECCTVHNLKMRMEYLVKNFMINFKDKLSKAPRVATEVFLSSMEAIRFTPCRTRAAMPASCFRTTTGNNENSFTPPPLSLNPKLNTKFIL